MIHCLRVPDGSVAFLKSEFQIVVVDTSISDLIPTPQRPECRGHVVATDVYLFTAFFAIIAIDRLIIAKNSYHFQLHIIFQYFPFHLCETWPPSPVRGATINLKILLSGGEKQVYEPSTNTAMWGSI